MKILVLGWNRWVDSGKKGRRYYKKGDWGPELFRRELMRQLGSDSVFYGRGYGDFDPSLTVEEIAKKYKPDILFTHCNGQEFTRSIGEIPKNIFKVHMAPDYWETNRKKYNSVYLDVWKYDLIISPVSEGVRLLKEGGYNARILPFSADTSIHYDFGFNRDIDIMASFSSSKKIYGETRRKILKLLRSGELPIDSFASKALWDDHVLKLNQSKIVANSVEKWDFLNQRFFEVLACNSLLLTDYAEDMETVGLEDKKHLVVFKGIDDFKDKLFYYLEHEEERLRIARAGYDFIRENHSTKKRVSEFLNIISEESR